MITNKNKSEIENEIENENDNDKENYPSRIQRRGNDQKSFHLLTQTNSCLKENQDLNSPNRWFEKVNCRSPLKICLNENNYSNYKEQETHNYLQQQEQQQKILKEKDRNDVETTLTHQTLTDNLEEFVFYDPGTCNQNQIDQVHQVEELRKSLLSPIPPLQNHCLAGDFMEEEEEEEEEEEKEQKLEDVNTDTSTIISPIKFISRSRSPFDLDTSDITTSDNQDDSEISETLTTDSIDHELDDLDSIIEEVFDNARNAIEMERNSVCLERFELPLQHHSTAFLLQREKSRQLEEKLNCNRIDLSDLSLSSQDSTQSENSISVCENLINSQSPNVSLKENPPSMIRKEESFPIELRPRYRSYFALTTLLVAVSFIWISCKILLLNYHLVAPPSSFSPLLSSSVENIESTPSSILHLTIDSLDQPFILPEDFLKVFEDVNICSLDDQEQDENILTKSNQKSIASPSSSSSSLYRPPSPSFGLEFPSSGVTVRKRSLLSSFSRHSSESLLEYLQTSNKISKHAIQIIQTTQLFHLQKKQTLKLKILNQLSKILTSLFANLRSRRRSHSRSRLEIK